MAPARAAEIRRAWTRFDRSTAFGCDKGGHEFDRVECGIAWRAYCIEVAKDGEPFPPSPIGLESERPQLS